MKVDHRRDRRLPGVGLVVVSFLFIATSVTSRPAGEQKDLVGRAAFVSGGGKRHIGHNSIPGSHSTAIIYPTVIMAEMQPADTETRKAEIIFSAGCPRYYMMDHSGICRLSFELQLGSPQFRTSAPASPQSFIAISQLRPHFINTQGFLWAPSVKPRKQKVGMFHHLFSGTRTRPRIPSLLLHQTSPKTTLPPSEDSTATTTTPSTSTTATGFTTNTIITSSKTIITTTFTTTQSTPTNTTTASPSTIPESGTSTSTSSSSSSEISKILNEYEKNSSNEVFEDPFDFIGRSVVPAKKESTKDDD